MRRALVIVGANYGDEGKGLAAYSAVREGESCLNVLINGGPQRGHTVDLPGGRRHVFHHFGSGALKGAVSCADRDFMVNPLLWSGEWQELRQNSAITPRLLVHGACRVTTPWDMMLGQMIEENRGRARHGSCGCGINETRVRFEQTDWALPFSALAERSSAALRGYARRIVEEYIPRRLQGLGMPLPDGWREVLADEGLLRAFEADLRLMAEHTEAYTDWAAAAAPYPLLVFEAGQGLALDEHNRADFPHLTPSRTGSQVSAARLAALPGPTAAAVRYVTRSYLTRHGAGPFPTECPKEAINPRMTDRTNVPNPHQETLRYGFFDAGAVMGRIEGDFSRSVRLLPGLRKTLLITHLNETGGRLCGDGELADFAGAFDEAWLSDQPWELRRWKGR